MRVALVYDRLNKLGGAERLLLAFHELFPQADWYTSLWDPKLAPFSRNWMVHTSWLNKLPYLRTRHEWLPWLMPFVFEAFEFSSYDLVISIGSAEAKGIITKPGTIHLAYCLTPTRYLYSHQSEYLSNSLYRFIARYLRNWDLVAATRPDEMIAISTQVKKRIKKYYKRDSTIIFPPVDTTRFAKSNLKLNDYNLPPQYFLVVSRLVPYKRIEILVRAANLTKKNLVVIGQGSEFAHLHKLAGPTVKLLGFVRDSDLPAYYQNCLAYLQANEEDFGISICEAQSCGRPVIAYGKGGALDIVIPGTTGILLPDNKVATFAKAMVEFDTMSFEPAACQQNASRFDQTNWTKQIKERIKDLCQTN